MLDAGAAIHNRDYGETGETAFLLAVRCSLYETVKWLLECGADVNDTHPDGNVALYNACTYAPSYSTLTATLYGAGNTALHYAATYLDLNMTRLLIGAGAHLDARNAAGRTPLMEAVHYMLDTRPVGGSHRLNKTEHIEELLERGVNTGIRDFSGKSVLDYFPRGLVSRLWGDPRIAKLRKIIEKSFRT